MLLWELRRLLSPSRGRVDVAFEYPAGAAAGLRLRMPFDGNWPLTQGFHGNHPAVDYGMPSYTPLKASVSGTVGRAGWDWSGYGYLVTLIGEGEWDGLYILYGHIPSGGLRVKAGDKVTVGQVVAVSDNTGNSTGPHLHYEARRKPWRYGLDCFDPRPYFVRDIGPVPPPPVPPVFKTYTVLKPSLTIYSRPDRKARPVLGHYQAGQTVSAKDVIDPVGSPEDWVITSANGYILKQINGKRYLREA